MNATEDVEEQQEGDRHLPVAAGIPDIGAHAFYFHLHAMGEMELTRPNE